MLLDFLYIAVCKTIKFDSLIRILSLVPLFSPKWSMDPVDCREGWDTCLYLLAHFLGTQQLSKAHKDGVFFSEYELKAEAQSGLQGIAQGLGALQLHLSGA